MEKNVSATEDDASSFSGGLAGATATELKNAGGSTGSGGSGAASTKSFEKEWRLWGMVGNVLHRRLDGEFPAASLRSVECCGSFKLYDFVLLYVHG